VVDATARPRQRRGRKRRGSGSRPGCRAPSGMIGPLRRQIYRPVLPTGRPLTRMPVCHQLFDAHKNGRRQWTRSFSPPAGLSRPARRLRLKGDPPGISRRRARRSRSISRRMPATTGCARGEAASIRPVGPGRAFIQENPNAGRDACRKSEGPVDRKAVGVSPGMKAVTTERHDDFGHPPEERKNNGCTVLSERLPWRGPRYPPRNGGPIRRGGRSVTRRSRSYGARWPGPVVGGGRWMKVRGPFGLAVDRPRGIAASSNLVAFRIGAAASADRLHPSWPRHMKRVPVQVKTNAVAALAEIVGQRCNKAKPPGPVSPPP